MLELNTDQLHTLIRHLSAENAELRLAILQYQIATTPVEEGGTDGSTEDTGQSA